MELAVVGGHSLTSCELVHYESDGVLKIGFVITHYLSMCSCTSSVAFTFKMMLVLVHGKLLPVSNLPGRYFTKENSQVSGLAAFLMIYSSGEEYMDCSLIATNYQLVLFAAVNIPHIWYCNRHTSFSVCGL